MNAPSALLWLGLFSVVILAIVVDLLVHRRDGRSTSTRSAWLEAAIWIGIALLFDLWILAARGGEPAIEFLTAYVVEKSLSIDNIFLFLLIFQAFRIPPEAQHRVLYLGVIGALAFRAAFVFAGVALLRSFEPVTYFFGAILLIAAIRMAFHPAANFVAKPSAITNFVRRILPVSADLPGPRFFVSAEGRIIATPLLLALIAIELADIIFAIDSVPAVLAVTHDPFIAYSSNVLAILGLRALYFVLAGLLRRVRFLHQGLALVLAFVGAKMILSRYVAIGASTSLAIIGSIFAVTLLASVLSRRPYKQI